MVGGSWFLQLQRSDRWSIILPATCPEMFTSENNISIKQKKTLISACKPKSIKFIIKLRGKRTCLKSNDIFCFSVLKAPSDFPESTYGASLPHTCISLQKPYLHILNHPTYIKQQSLNQTM